MKVLVTGGSGFIGSAVLRHLVRHTDATVTNVDALTYAATPEAAEEVQQSPRYAFEHSDIRDLAAMRALFAKHDPDAVMHLAAESHVDRSIDGPAPFIQTNVNGTMNMLEVARAHWEKLPSARQQAFRFHHISTDEVFGTLSPDDPPFCETTPYAPNSPYAASKASSDHLARAWHHTYGLPVVISNCSNNYGLWQFPEKLIPLMVLNALAGKPLPVYGDGAQVRDWLHVDDHARALVKVLTEGTPGETYCIGGAAERKNIDLVRLICRLMDALAPKAKPHESLISHVADRPGHDRRYAIDFAKIERELGWRPQETFESGIEKTVRWYLDNPSFWQPIRKGRYSGERLGLGAKTPSTG